MVQLFSFEKTAYIHAVYLKEDFLLIHTEVKTHGELY